MMVMVVSLLLLTLPKAFGDIFWGLLSIWPIPLPITHDTQVFPQLFPSTELLGSPYLPADSTVKPLITSLNFKLRGSLCFLWLATSETTMIQGGNLSLIQ